MMALDECPPGTSDYDYARKSLGLTQRWLQRGWKRYRETEGLYGYRQAYFPIVQGCVYPDLRREAAKFIADLGADGNAIGGLAVGEPTEKMYEMIEVVNEILPADFSPLDEGGPSFVDEVYSKAYVRHLFISNEILAMQIASIHNLAFYLWLVGEARKHIVEGDFKSWKEAMVERVTRRL